MLNVLTRKKASSKVGSSRDNGHGSAIHASGNNEQFLPLTLYYTPMSSKGTFNVYLYQRKSTSWSFIVHDDGSDVSSTLIAINYRHCTHLHLG